MRITGFFTSFGGVILTLLFSLFAGAAAEDRGGHTVGNGDDIYEVIAARSEDGGGHTVGNGGDLADLKVVRIWQNLHLHVNPCFNSSNPCNLETAELNVLQDFRHKHTRKGPLDLVASAEAWRYKTEPVMGATIAINKRHLYRDGRSIEQHELVQLLLEAMFAQMGEEASLGQGLATAITTNLTFQVEEVVGFYWGEKFYIHHVDTAVSPLEMYIDFEEKSFDFSAKFLSQSPCELGVKSSKFESLWITQAGQGEIKAEGSVLYHCAEELSLLGRFRFSVQVDGGLPVENTDHVFIYNLEER